MGGHFPSATGRAVLCSFRDFDDFLKSLSIVGPGPLTANQLIATMPELGCLDDKQAASLAALASVARQAGQWKGNSFIRGGRANVRRALFMPALIAERFNPDLKAKYQQMLTAGKPAKIAITPSCESSS